MAESPKWRKYLFPGLSGLVVGAVAVLARHRRRRREIGIPERIPEDTEFSIGTMTVRIPYKGETYRSNTVYRCEPTQFKVWSFLKGPSEGQAEDSAPSFRIYHVSPEVVYRRDDGEVAEIVEQERFYATIHAWSQRYGSVTGHIAKGAFVEFRTCHVGGSMNGVETGEKLISSARVQALEFGEALPNESVVR